MTYFKVTDENFKIIISYSTRKTRSVLVKYFTALICPLWWPQYRHYWWSGLNKFWRDESYGHTSSARCSSVSVFDGRPIPSWTSPFTVLRMLVIVRARHLGMTHAPPAKSLDSKTPPTFLALLTFGVISKLALHSAIWRNAFWWNSVVHISDTCVAWRWLTGRL